MEGVENVSQRINAPRAVFSANMNSSLVRKPGSGYALPQIRRTNNMHLRAVGPLEQPTGQPTKIEPTMPPSDRRMSRRNVHNQTIMPRAISRQPVSLAPLQEPAQHMEVSPVHPLTEDRYPEQVQGKTVHNETREHIPPEYVSPSLNSEADVIEESYLIDRPVYLLSQKYFGTRY